MTDTFDENGMSHRPGLVSPSDFASYLPSSPVLRNPAGNWHGSLLELYRHPLGPIEAPAQTHNLIVSHLTGPVLIENDRGGGRFEKRWMGPGLISVTPTSTPTRRIIRGRTEVILVYLDPMLLPEIRCEFDGSGTADIMIVPRFGVPDTAVDQLIRLLLAEAEAPGPATSLMVGLLTRALAVQLMRSHSDTTLRAPEHFPIITAPRLRRIIEMMRSRLDEELTLERLAAAAKLSPSHFARAFRQATGQSPHRYLVCLRIEQAQALLETTELPIIEIALRCGFGQPSHFATAFRKVTEHSPREWRELRRE